MASNSYVRCWLHLLWPTFQQEKCLPEQARIKVSKYLYKYAEEKGIYMRKNYVNPDHVHALVSLPSNLSIQELLQLLKGSSSHWINQQNLLESKFAWDNEYAAFSVSHSKVKSVETFIQEQERWHWKMSFQQEYELLLKKHEFYLSTK